jgi:hypothetical protein
MAELGKKCLNVLILALAEGRSNADAARRAGCSERTVRRRLKLGGTRSRAEGGICSPESKDVAALNLIGPRMSLRHQLKAVWRTDGNGGNKTVACSSLPRRAIRPESAPASGRAVDVLKGPA